MKVYADENWVTINGVHVLIGGNGKIVKGPAKFVGSTVADLKGQKMTESKKKELQSKYGKKSDDKGSEKTVTKRKSTREKESGGPKKSQSFGRKPKETPETEKNRYYNAKSKGMTDSQAKSFASKSSESNLAPHEKLALESGLGRNTDYSKMTKSQIEAGMAKLEKAISKTDDPFTIDSYDQVLFKASEALCSGKYNRQQKKTTPDPKQQSKATPNKATVGKFNEHNIPQVAGVTKSMNKKIANNMNKGMSFDEAFSKALSSAGYGPHGRRGMFR